MKKILVLALILSLLVVPLASCGEEESSDIDVLFLSVGKADAILIEIGETNILIDTGYEVNYNTVKTALNNENVSRIDHMILTHFDEDHIGSVGRLLGTCQVGTLYLPNYTGTGGEYQTLAPALATYSGEQKRVSEPLSLTVGAFTIQIDPTQLTLPDEDDNNHSLIVSVKGGGFSMLLLGDAEKDRVNEYAARDKGPYDIVKLPHHGDHFKALVNYLDVITPTYAVHCCEAGEVHEKLTAACNERKITQHTTGDGDIRVTYNIAHDHITVTQK